MKTHYWLIILSFISINVHAVNTEPILKQNQTSSSVSIKAASQLMPSASLQ